MPWRMAFRRSRDLAPGIKAQTYHTGNPVRPSVLAAAAVPYRVPGDGTFDLLVTGGSQGARVMADIVPPAIALLSPQERGACASCSRRAARIRCASRKPIRSLRGRCRSPAVFCRSSGACRRGLAGDRARRRLDGVGTRRHRPAVDPGSVSACAGSGSGGQCRASLAATGAAQVVRETDFTPQWLADGAACGAAKSAGACLTRGGGSESGNQMMPRRDSPIS